MKVLVAIPFARYLEGQAVASIIPMITQTLQDGDLLDVIMSGHNLLSAAREACADLAIAARATHLLFVDSDMVVPRDLVKRLAQHTKPVVSALYFMRTHPWDPVASFHVEHFQTVGRDVALADKGLLKVHSVGLGACLIRTEVLRNIRSTGKRMFEFYPGQGEDLCFAERCRENGVSVWLDRSTQCGHVTSEIVDQFTFDRHVKPL